MLNKKRRIFFLKTKLLLILETNFHSQASYVQLSLISPHQALWEYANSNIRMLIQVKMYYFL